jgi:DMSO/TMAO reductase YedYZ molybdopterin-dependent catalytic subunit
VRGQSPQLFESTLEALGADTITPVEHFFVRSHYAAPVIDPLSWNLEVSGLVRQPLALSLVELAMLHEIEPTHTLECSGNGRAFYPDMPPGEIPWGLGAVGTARWRGVRLGEVLERAGLLPEARHVWLEAADRPERAGDPKFLRSLPIEKALDDVLLAHSMNGVPLPTSHGGPVRAIVPGWFGMASTKWLTGVKVMSEPSQNHFQRRGYRYAEPGQEPTGAPAVETLRVKSLITRPLEGDRAPRGMLRAEGFAWAGADHVRSVEVSADGGTTWKPAALGAAPDGVAWRRWSADLEVRQPGAATVMARATDYSGATQPLAAHPNANGYGNNSVQRVRVEVV